MDQTPLRSFGMYLRGKREGLGYTLEQLGNKIDMPYQFLWRVEQGQVPFPPSRLMSISAALCITPREIIQSYSTATLNRVLSEAGIPTGRFKLIYEER